MKIVTIIARLLLGLAFVVFGLNGFLHFLPMGPLPPAASPAGHFFAATYPTGFLKAVSGFQLLGGVLLLLGFYVPLGLTILAPIVVNILLFHIFLAPQNFGPGIVVTILEVFLIWRYWPNFRGLVQR